MPELWPYLLGGVFLLGFMVDALVSVAVVRRWIVPTVRQIEREAQLLELAELARSPAYADLSFAQVVALEGWLRAEQERSP